MPAYQKIITRQFFKNKQYEIVKIIDCFNYFDEDLILEIRLATLFDYVDKFIICEATLDHAGNEKKLNFDIKKFKR